MPTISPITTLARPIRLSFKKAPVFIIIDSLDECEEEHREGLVSALAAGVHNFPADFCVLLTALPGGCLEISFDGGSAIRILRMKDDVLRVDTEYDILAHTRSLLSGCLSDDRCVHLAWNEEAPIPFRFVMSRVLVAFEPFSLDVLAILGWFAPKRPSEGLDLQENVRSAGDEIGALMNSMMAATAALLYVPLLTPFRDFLTGEERGKAFFVDVGAANCLLACERLGLMSNALRHNIALGTSHVRNV
ncbi:hypothetical protein K488DRAFT_83065 [Vararia minispora EC-137]|uniref:Uncharacterized protein n=1 Tax=Vararia minispora EC-137 TaxID=1314806 RepID=A0ACB8QVC1_9AGAM|nr:hypothetical protein K488DRAFT_83065 [Vararia minispora EC-137]